MALATLFVVGAVVQVPRAEADLAARVQQELAAEGFRVAASFSGQDGTLRCVAPLADPADAERLAAAVWGVRAVTLDASCGDASVPVSIATTTTTTTVVPVPVPTTLAATTTTSAPPATTAPTTATTTSVAAAVQFTVRLVDGRFLLSGAVASDLERLALVQTARSATAATNVVDELVVDPQVPTVPSERFIAMVDLLPAMPINLVAASLGWNGSEVSLSGSYATDVARASFAASASAAGIQPSLAPRPTASGAQASMLEFELNALVAATPILFDKGSATISDASAATVQQVAGLAKRYAGLSIEVQGHTDSEGDPARNLTLSEQRAASVSDALVALGVPAADLTSKGFGVTQLITDDNGNEIPEQSRRVVFGVALN